MRKPEFGKRDVNSQKKKKSSKSACFYPEFCHEMHLLLHVKFRITNVFHRFEVGGK